MERVNSLRKIVSTTETLRLFRVLVDQSNDALFVMDPKTSLFSEVNNKACLSLGYTREELLGMGVIDIEAIVPDCFSWKAHVEEVRKTGSMLLEGAHKRKDGSTFPVEVNVRYVSHEKQDYMISIVRDITERKKVEQKLIERVKELNCLYGISRLVEREDISLEEILQGTADLMPLSWRYPDVTCARITLDGLEYKTGNCKETKWKQSEDILVYNEVIGSVGVCYLGERPESDGDPFLKEERFLINAIAERLGRVVERIRAEEAKERASKDLRKSEQWLAEIFETSLDAITVLDSEGRIVRCNDALVEMHGYSSKKELIGKDVLDLVAEKDRARAGEGFKETLTGPVKSVEYTCVAKDGRVFTTETSASVIEGYPDELTYVVAVSKDVSERRDLQKMLLEKEEAVLRETGVVLHEELAQALASAKMRSELAYSALDKESPGAEHIREVTEAIKQAIVDMRNMSSLLFPLHLQHLGLSGALNQLSAEAESRHGIDCRFEYDKKDVSIADNIALQFYRIAQQAFNNAVQHGNPDDRDDFEVRIRLVSKSGKITLTVRDNGVGFQDQAEADMGIKHMDYRARIIGASFDIKSGKGKGTTVTVSYNKKSTPPHLESIT